MAGAAALVTGMAVAVAVPAHAVAPTATYTWTGQGTSGSGDWNDGANWAGGVAPTPGATVNLDFPDLPTCDSGTPAGDCYTSADDLSSLTVASLTVEGPGYTITDDTGKALTVGALGVAPAGSGLTIGGTATITLSGGITADFTGSGSGSGSVTIDSPLDLTGAQTWSATSAQFTVNGALTGTDPLTIDIPGGTTLTDGSADDEVGDLDISGVDPSTAGALDIGLNNKLNATDHHTVTVSDGAQLDGTAETGPFTSTGGVLYPGSGRVGTLIVSGAATLDAASSLTLALLDSGSEAGSANDNVEATGAVTLGGAQLAVTDGDTSSPSPVCFTPTQGTTYTLVSGSSISGQLSSADVPGGQLTTIPNGGHVELEEGTCSNAPDASLQINYGATAVTAVVSPAITTTLLDTPAADAGSPVDLTADVQPDPSTAVASGTVSYTTGGAAIPGCSNLPVTGDGAGDDQATCTTTFATAGSYDVTATYSGETTTASPTLPSSDTETETVSPAGTPTPPQSGNAPTQTSTGTNPSASASGTTANATGTGTLTTTDYGSSDQVGAPAGFSSSGEYFDVQAPSPNTFSTVTVTQCTLNGGSSLYWWNGSTWAPVYPEVYSPATGCVTATLSATSSPTIAQLDGTPFAVGTPSPGYQLAARDGGIFSYGAATYAGSHGGSPLNKPIVGTAETPDGQGYWLVASDGGIFAYGDAAFSGSHGGSALNEPIVGMASTPDGRGYWLVASDGGIFAYGDAAFYGSHGGSPLNKPIVGMASTPDGKGYWLVASDGGIFAYGDAAFSGSHGGSPLNEPIVGMAASPDGQGYQLVASDGGIFAYGDAAFSGSHGGSPLNKPIVGMASTPDGRGYWLVASDGGIFAYGDAPFVGSHGGSPLNQPVVGLAGR